MNKPHKVVIITGAARGIGKAIAETFAQAQWKIIVNYRNSAEQANNICRDIEKLGGEAYPFQADVADTGAVRKMVDFVLKTCGRIDALINNAGLCKNSSLARMDDNAWDTIIAADLTGPWNMIRACAPTMISQNSGNIINISSIGGLRGMAGSANYATAKGALIDLTIQAARELGTQGVCINAVLPGFHLTGMGANASKDYIQAAKNESVLSATTDINELANFILLLASTKTISGQIFNWDSRTI